MSDAAASLARSARWANADGVGLGHLTARAVLRHLQPLPGRIDCQTLHCPTSMRRASASDLLGPLQERVVLEIFGASLRPPCPSFDASRNPWPTSSRRPAPVARGHRRRLPERSRRRPAGLLAFEHASHLITALSRVEAGGPESARDQEGDRRSLQLQLIGRRPASRYVKIHMVIHEHLAADQVLPAFEIGGLDRDGLGLRISREALGASRQTDISRRPDCSAAHGWPSGFRSTRGRTRPPEGLEGFCVRNEDAALRGRGDRPTGLGRYRIGTRPSCAPNVTRSPSLRASQLE